jgi:hypothetical protein
MELVGMEEVVISTSKVKKIYFSDREMVVYIIDSGYVDESDETLSSFMYHVIEENAYGQVSLSLLNKSSIHGKYLVDVFTEYDTLNKQYIIKNESEHIDDMLDAMLLIKEQVNK